MPRDRDRDRPRQARPPGLRVRRHRRRALAGAPATRRRSRSPGRSTPTASSCPFWPRRWTRSSRRRPRSDRASSAASAVLDLEGLWTRYDDPAAAARRDRRARPERDATRRMQEIYAAPIKAELITAAHRGDPRRRRHRRPPRCRRSAPPQFWKAVVDAGVDLFVIRGTTVSAEHVSGAAEPLNLKQFIYELDVPVIVGGCATYTAALHLMRTGAAGVLVGFGGGAAHTTRDVLGIQVPMATAVADVAAARRDYMDESGGRYVHVIADGGVGAVRRHRQGRRLRRRRGDDRLAAGPRHRGARPRLPLGLRGAPRRAAARRAGRGRHGRHAGGDPARARPRRRRHR